MLVLLACSSAEGRGLEKRERRGGGGKWKKWRNETFLRGGTAAGERADRQVHDGGMKAITFNILVRQRAGGRLERRKDR